MWMLDFLAIQSIHLVQFIQFKTCACACCRFCRRCCCSCYSCSCCCSSSCSCLCWATWRTSRTSRGGTWGGGVGVVLVADLVVLGPCLSFESLMCWVLLWPLLWLMTPFSIPDLLSLGVQCVWASPFFPSAAFVQKKNEKSHSSTSSNKNKNNNRNSNRLTASKTLKNNQHYDSFQATLWGLVPNTTVTSKPPTFNMPLQRARKREVKRVKAPGLKIQQEEKVLSL